MKEDFQKSIIRIVTKKVVLDILMGFSMEIDDQIGLLEELKEDLEIEVNAQLEEPV